LTSSRPGVGAAPLAGRVALVTGVSRRVGIGFAVADRLAALGADLFIHGFARYDATHP
jgi:3-oxoacyl-[acyl-carrier protein] reductase